MESGETQAGYDGAIYTITCKANQRVYVGLAHQPNTRIDGHRKALVRGRHALPDMQADWDEHGAESFRFDVVETFTALAEDAFRREHEWIVKIGESRRLYNRRTKLYISTSWPFYRKTTIGIGKELDRAGWLTVKQAAEIATVGEQSIRRWIHLGRLRGHMISRREGYRIDRRDLVALLTFHPTPAPAPEEG